MKQAAAATFAFIGPMKALPVTDLPVGDWIYELKFDGYRALAFKAGKEARLISRNRTNFDNDYPQLIDALRSLTAKQATIDGEIAALDDQGRSSFQLLQSYGKAKKTPLVYLSIMPSICSFWTGPTCVPDR
jgi:bifunctional non-homologous end joining protein LigD